MKRIFSILFALVLAVSLMLVPAASVGASPGPGLVGLWHFDGNANDSSGNGNHGTVSGATYVSGKFGQALSFDGSDDYVEVAHDASLEPSEITIEGWIYPLSWNHTPTAVALAVKRTAFGNGYFLFWYASTSTINFDWGGSSGANRWNTGYNPPLNTWTHLAVTRSSAGRALYVNGALYSSTTHAGAPANVPTTSALRVGYDSMAARYPFKGSIDEVRIWDTATRSFVLDAEPEEDVNPQDTQHTITATVEISKVGGGTTPAPGETVNFDVTGANPQSGSDDTDSSGVATFTYTGSMMGTDTINAWVDQDWSGDFNSANDAWDEVTKTWLEHYVTGGGLIETGKGKEAAKITFGGNVGFDLAGDEVGQWNINFHNVNNNDLDKGNFHSTEIIYIDFVDYPALPDPSPPEADVNYVRFDALGKFNGQDGWRIRVNATDFGEGNKTEPDEIRIRLWNGNSLVYDSYLGGGGDFPDESFHVRTDLDGGNIQIHPPEIPEL